MLKGFDPIIAKQPYAMILGSMPSVTSLDKQEYYGFVHNRFWKILSSLYHMPIDTYDQKKQIILQHHLILWDVIGECEREGSLDSKIRKEKVNDIAALISAYTDLHMVICNGRKSYDLYQKHFARLKVECIYVPSTSNANRTMTETDLYEAWAQGLKKAGIL